jgi:ketosteroid isomerase-like protein
MTEENKEVARTYLKALGTGDTATMDSILAEGMGTHCRGTSMISGKRERQDVLDFVDRVPQVFKDGIRFEFESITAEEDRVACQLKGFSTLANGEEYNNEYVFLFFFRDGKICHMDEYIDTAYADEVLRPLMAEQMSPEEFAQYEQSSAAK